MNTWFFSASRAGCMCVLSVIATSLISLAPPALAQNVYPVNTTDTAGASPAPPTSPVQPASPTSQETLDGLLAPIALYPDALLAQVLMASTYPLDVAEAARWQKENANLSEQELQDALVSFDWDPSVKSLVTVPEVLHYMSSSPRWMQGLGRAVMEDQEWVMASVQELRQKAHTAGTLTSNDKQSVNVDVVDETEYITITPASPRAVYVPVYDPYIVYGTWWWPSRPYYWGPPLGMAFLAGFFWSSYHYPSIALWGGFNWGLGAMIVNVPIYRNYYRVSPPSRPHNVWHSSSRRHPSSGPGRAWRSSSGYAPHGSGRHRSTMRPPGVERSSGQGVSGQRSPRSSVRPPERRPMHSSEWEPVHSPEQRSARHAERGVVRSPATASTPLPGRSLEERPTRSPEQRPTRSPEQRPMRSSESRPSYNAHSPRQNTYSSDRSEVRIRHERTQGYSSSNGRSSGGDSSRGGGRRSAGRY